MFRHYVINHQINYLLNNGIIKSRKPIIDTNMIDSNYNKTMFKQQDHLLNNKMY